MKKVKNQNRSLAYTARLGVRVMKSEKDYDRKRDKLRLRKEVSAL